MAEAAQEQKQPVAAMTEAGFSMNVKMIDKFGQEVQLTFRAPQVHHAEKLLGHYESVVARVLTGGWQTLKAGARPAANGAPSGGETPICRVHNAQMRPSKKAGSFYCPRKDGDAWCKEKVDTVN